MYAIAKRFTAEERRTAFELWSAGDENVCPIGALLRARFHNQDYSHPIPEEVAAVLAPYDANNDDSFQVWMSVDAEATRFIKDYEIGRMGRLLTALGLRETDTEARELNP
ncbi:MAG: hypothetical protein GEU71_03545 [Actinobacteria bacterium]|nr:hypothetical protein [Actinomycetota bacterium]